MMYGDDGARTHDLLTASQALSQLSYAPKITGYEGHSAKTPYVQHHTLLLFLNQA